MAAYIAVGNPHGHPYGAKLSFAFADHLKDPGFIRVGNGKRFPFACVPVFFSQFAENCDRFTCSLCTLQRDIDQRTVIDDGTFLGLKFFTSAIGGFTDGHLVFVHVADHVVGMFNLRDFSQGFPGVPFHDIHHGTGRPVAGRPVIQFAIECVGIGRIGDHDRPVGSSPFSKDKVGTGHCVIAEACNEQHQHQANKGFFHKKCG